MKKKKIVLQAGSNKLTLNFKKMKKIAFILLISMISSFGAFAKNTKPSKIKKVAVVGGCTYNNIFRGRVIVGNVFECTDNRGRTTRIISMNKK